MACVIDCSIKTNTLQIFCVPKIVLFFHIFACRKMSHLQFPKYKLLNKSYVNVKFSEVSEFEKLTFLLISPCFSTVTWQTADAYKNKTKQKKLPVC